MISVASAAAIGFVAVGWLFKYGLGFADDPSAALKLDASTAAAALAVSRTALCFWVWYGSAAGADGPAIATTLLSIGALVEFSSLQTQSAVAASSSSSAVLLATRAAYDGMVTTPLLLVFASVASLSFY